MNVPLRTFRVIIHISTLLSFSTLLIDLDHWYYITNQWDTLAVHYDPQIQLLFCLCVGLITAALSVRRSDLK